MTDSINVKPGKGGTAVPVATDVIDAVHYPVYKVSFGEDGAATLVDSDNGLPIALPARQTHNFARQEELLEDIVLQLRLLNKYMSIGHDEEFTASDLEE